MPHEDMSNFMLTHIWNMNRLVMIASSPPGLHGHILPTFLSGLVSHTETEPL